MSAGAVTRKTNLHEALGDTFGVMGWLTPTLVHYEYMVGATPTKLFAGARHALTAGTT